MVKDFAGGLMAELTSTPAMERVFSDACLVQEMLRFEWALSAALVDCGLAPEHTSRTLKSLLDTDFLTPARAATLRSAAPLAGNLAIPFVKLLTTVMEQTDPEAARFLHQGATSQDALDTALILQVRHALPLLQHDLEATLTRSIQLARLHQDTILPGRTWLQQGPPITLGLKFAGYAAALSRHRERLGQTAKRAVVLQFGGAVGTLASLRGDGLRVSAAMSRHLGLPEPTLPWHAHRDTLCELATVLGLLVGTLGKMARDISLSMQTEVGELLEPGATGRGGSSTMPHKRNPVGCAVALAAAIRVPSLVATMLVAMVQEHERGLGGWQAEWETLPQIFRLTAGALSQIRQILDELEVHADCMQENLDRTHGLVLAEAVSAALAGRLGGPAAHRIVEEASRRALLDKQPLESILRMEPTVQRYFSDDALHQLFDASQYLGSSREFIERTLASLDSAED